MPNKRAPALKPGETSELYKQLSMFYRVMFAVGVVLAGTCIYKIITEGNSGTLLTDAIYYLAAGGLFFLSGVLMDKKNDKVILLLTTVVGGGVIYQYVIGDGLSNDMFTLVSILMLGGLYLVWYRGEFKKAKEQS